MSQKKIKTTTKVETDELQVELIPVFENSVDYQNRKKDIQEILCKMIILAKTRGRPRKDDGEEIPYAA